MNATRIAALATFVIAALTLGSAQEVPPPEHAAFDLETLREQALRGERVWSPFLDRNTLHCGLYRLAAGATDGQSPHEEDEVYYVTRGRATLHAGAEQHEAHPGSILFVAAGVPHRFVDITEDLEVVVFFSKAPPEKR